MAKGDWLGIGGSDPSNHGGGWIEVRVANEGAAWEWRKIPRETLRALLDLLNEHPKRRDDLLRYERSHSDIARENAAP
jgi:hypothetical protein